MEPGELVLVLLGELGKINPVSGVRLADITLDVEGKSVRVELVCSPGERITLTWLLSPVNYDQVRDRLASIHFTTSSSRKLPQKSGLIPKVWGFFRALYDLMSLEKLT